MAGNMADVALRVTVNLQNFKISDKGPMEQRKQDRLEKAVSALLEFKSEGEVIYWFTVKNRGFGNIAPIDLVESEYATKDLLSVIKTMKSKFLAKISQKI